jgi:hypothetical protein
VRSLVVVVAALLTGCADLLAPPAEAPEACTFPPGTELAFAGHASPFELGFGAEFENVRGGSYVTAGPVQPGRMGDVPPQRWYCYVATNSAAWWPVPDNWTPPAIELAPEAEPVSTPPAPQPEPGAGQGSSFPECAGATYDFVGESTLAALNIQAHVPAQLPQPGRPAMIWVTHDLRPHDAGPPGGPVQMTRMLCFEFADGSGGSGWPVDEAWQPPDP